jgi:hypothetical protein
MVLPGPDDLPEAVTSKYIHGVTLKDNEAISQHLYRHFLPNALADGAFKCVPPPLVAGEGLEGIQDAIDLLRRGVSARKVVVNGI